MKLIRDKIPEMLMTKGKIIQIRRADDAEYGVFLIQKLQEEVSEFIDSRNIEEIADIEEVLRCLAQHNGIDWNDIENLRTKKNEERGSFKKKIILERVVHEK